MNERRNLTTLVVGLVLVVVGGVFLAGNLVGWRLDWWRALQFALPALLCLWGISKLARHFAWDAARLDRQPSKGGLLGGLFWLGVGTVWLLDLIGVIQGLTFFGLYWPAIVVLFGLGKILDYYRFGGSSQFRAGEVVGLIFVILFGVCAKAAADAHLPLLRFPVWLGEDGEGIKIGDYLGRKYSFASETDIPVSSTLKTLQISNLYGDVTVKPGSSDAIRIKLTKEVVGGEEEEAKRSADQVEITWTESEAGVLLVGTNRADLQPSKSRFSSHLALTVPATLALQISNEYGNVRAAGMERSVTIENSYGEVEVEDVSGAVEIKNRYRGTTVRRVSGDVKIENQRGRVLVEDIQGGVTLSTERETLTARSVSGDALVRNHFGNVTLEGVEGAAKVDGRGSSVTLADIGKDVVVENSYRSFEAENLRGGLELDTSNCSVQVSSVTGPVAIRASQASVEARELGASVSVQARGTEVRLVEIAGGFDVATSLRSVTIEDFSGRGEVQNEYGEISIRATEPVTEPLNASNKNGQITLYMPADPNLKLSAQAPGGRVTSDFNPRAEASDEAPSALEATLGRGGPPVRLQTTYGRIEIRRN